MDRYIVVNRIKLLFCLVSGLGLGVIAYLDYQASYTTVAMFTFVISGLLLLNALLLIFKYKVKTGGYFDRLLMTLVILYSLLASEYGNPFNLYWIYIVPISAFFLFKLTPALLLTLTYIPVAIYIIKQNAQPLHEAQIFFSFAMVYSVSLFLAIVKSRTNKLLEPLINRDVTSGAQLDKFLRPALRVEINRAEREGTGLLLMHIETPALKRSNSQEELEQLISTYAKAISKHLRLFDQYFRLDNKNFSVILPHATSQEAENTATKILQDVPIEKAKQTTFGFASLNVGDTEDSLIKISQQGLKHV